MFSLRAEASATTAAVGAVVAAAGPLLGDYVVMLLASLLGGLVSLSSQPPHASRWDGAKYLFRCVAVAFSFAWVASLSAAAVTGHDHVTLLWPVAFFLAWSGDRLVSLRDRLLRGLSDAIGKLGNLFGGRS